MANVQVPGFIPYAKGGLTCETRRMRVLSNATDPICKGDALDAGSGCVIAHTTENGEVYSVQWGGATYIDADGNRIIRPRLPAATVYSGTTVENALAAYVYGVNDMVTQQFRASVDEAIVNAGQHDNYAMVLTVSTTNFSAHELDATGAGTTATLPWRVIEIIKGDPKSNPDQADAHVVCMVNAGRREPALEPDNGSLGT